MHFSRKLKVVKKLALLFLCFLLVAGFSSPQNHGKDQARHKVLQNLVKNPNMKARILWYDLSANLFLLDTPEKVRNIVKKTAEANFDTIVLDVKNSTGYVAYNSNLAPHISTSTIPAYQGYPENYDLLQTVIQEAKKYNIKVHANINVFSEGSTTYQEGPAYEHPEWQSVLYQTIRMVKNNHGAEHRLSGTNITRLTDYLVMYTPNVYDVSPANRWGAEVQVVEGVVTQIVDQVTTGGPPLSIPENGYVLSGHGTARTWILNNLQVGDEIDITVETQFIPASQAPGHSTFVNPIREDVQNYELGIIEELVRNYDIDGIVLDRARYNNIYADFSDLSREKFEEYIGHPVTNWPEDIFTIEFDNHQEKRVPGPLYQKWIEWRAKNIQDFFKKAEQLIHGINEDIYFSTYVGSWYPDSYSEGVNWASTTYKPNYHWTSEDYHKTGIAQALDFLMTGNYYEVVTKEEAREKNLSEIYTVEGSAELTMEVIHEATFVYGSLYLNQYQHRPEVFREAIRTILEKNHGIMIFDLIYLENFGWWDIVTEELQGPKQTPHHIPGLLKLIRDDQLE